MKTVIDHTIRDKMNLSCSEYVVLDCILKGDKNQGVPFIHAELLSARSGLRSKGFILFVDNAWQATEKALSYLKPDNTNLVYDVIKLLNQESNANYRAHAAPTIKTINARVADGYTYEDFVKVIKFKCKEWLHTDQEQYLRPITLFGNKFEGYLQAANKAVEKMFSSTGMNGMVM